jgi:cobalt-zinc-cadmium efflux system membrane fusion protein
MTGKETGMRQALITIAAAVVASVVGFVVARVTAPTSESVAITSEAPKEAQGETVAISPADLAAAGILTEVVASGNLSTSVIAPAMVDAEIRGEAVITAHVAGTVVQIAKRLGDTVKAGETLGAVESRDAAALAAARDVAESRLNLARSVLAREKTLYDQLITPRQDLERVQADLETAEAEARRARSAAEAAHVKRDGKTVAVISPLSGTITSRTAALGLYVQAETELFRVSDPRFIDVDAAVTSSDVQRIGVGDQAKVTTRSGITVNAVVRSVSPTVNEQTRSATVVLDPLPKQPPLTPGELVQVEIMPKNIASSGVVVAEEAVQNLEGRSVVFVRTATGFKAQPVVVGAHNAGKVLILSGLNAGTTIANANAFLLKAELGKGAGEDE